MTTASTTLRDLKGLGHTPSSLSESALIMIDCQNTYREGIMKLEGVENALEEGKKLLERARALGIPIFTSGTMPAPALPMTLTITSGP